MKRVISGVSGIPVERIADGAAFREDLELDSLALLEIGVDVDYEFRLGIEELDRHLAALGNVDDLVAFVSRQLADRRS
ncbi:MAG: acyl carrier protein [Thermoanaerobaculia bacterium]